MTVQICGKHLRDWQDNYRSCTRTKDHKGDCSYPLD
ncbi:hypothetical protein LCGC14_1470070 [marine sediment metagenome]|uniref:Uncharacterized protein n=1 Tax=marine sediment metagenome TaxID=412755 RepID=A0A0F9LT23_9ZZZZ